MRTAPGRVRVTLNYRPGFVAFPAVLCLIRELRVPPMEVKGSPHSGDPLLGFGCPVRTIQQPTGAPL